MTDLWNAGRVRAVHAGRRAVSQQHALRLVRIAHDVQLRAGQFEPYLTCTEPIALPMTDGALELRFRSWSEGEDDHVWDTRIAQVSGDGGTSWFSLPNVLSSDRWLEERIDISRFAGQTVRVRFQFGSATRSQRTWAG
jgi:hypothetical protein